jgi:manganese efflux pump family protein
MSGFELWSVALGLSMDAFAVSLGAGTHQQVHGLRPAFRLWFHFGLFQSLMTIAGWFVGAGLEQVIAAWGHWLALVLLCLVGGKMVKEGFSADNGSDQPAAGDPSRGLKLVSLSVATSLDALAVGVSLGVLNVAIWQPGIVIGLVTALLSLVGIRLGQFLGAQFGKKMEVAGGIVLCLIGVKMAFFA